MKLARRMRKMAIIGTMATMGTVAMGEMGVDPIHPVPVEPKPILEKPQTAEEFTRAFNKYVDGYEIVIKGNGAVKITDGNETKHLGELDSEGKIVDKNENIWDDIEEQFTNHIVNYVKENNKGDVIGIPTDPDFEGKLPGHIGKGDRFRTPELNAKIKQAKLDVLNSELEGREFIVDEQEGHRDESVVIKGVVVHSDGKVEYKKVTVNEQGNEEIEYGEYQMDGSYSKEIRQGILKARKKIDPITPPGIGPVEPGHPNDGDLPPVEDQPVRDELREQKGELVDAGRTLKAAVENGTEELQAKVALTEEKLAHELSLRDQQISSNSKKIDNLEQDMERGLAMTAAMTQVNFGPLEEGEWGIGAGIGGYNSTQAVAIGIAAQPTENLTVNTSISTYDATDIAYGAGLFYKFGN